MARVSPARRSIRFYSRWTLALLAIGFAILAALSEFTAFTRFSGWPGVTGIRFVDGRAVLGSFSDSTADAPQELSVVDVPFLFEFDAFTNHYYYLFHLETDPVPTFDGWELHIHLWPLVALFGAYPVTAVTIEHARDIRRRRRGLCLRCGYDLTGNVSGACSECGWPVVRSK